MAKQRNEQKLIFMEDLPHSRSFPGSEVKNPPASSGDAGLIPGSGISLGEKKWQPTPVFFPGESHRQRSLVGYSPWGCERVKHNLATKQQQQQQQQ